MPAHFMEEMLLEGQREVKQLFEFVTNNADAMDSYSIEKAIFSRLMGIGLAAMKGYFAEKGTGDIGDVLQLDDETTLKREKRLLEKIYFSVFGKLSVPRACYRAKGVDKQEAENLAKSEATNIVGNTVWCRISTSHRCAASR